MNISLITLFPELIEDALNWGVIGRAKKLRLFQLFCYNPRAFAVGSQKRVDDAPYGGGPGMVMMAEPLAKAVEAAREPCPQAPVVYLSPQGKSLQQKELLRFSGMKNLIVVCGRYEGVDERFIEQYVDEEWSLGDFVLSGGEFPALSLIDGIIRLLPGALGDDASSVDESFSKGWLEYPHYTRPESTLGTKVPEVLLSGNHQNIEKWRHQASLRRTLERRPELINWENLAAEDSTYLNMLNEKIDDAMSEKE